MPALMRAVISITATIFILAGNSSAQKADPAVYGALPDVSFAEISPDGKTVAMMMNINGQSTIVFYNLDSPGEKPAGTSISGVKTRSIQWANNDYLLLHGSAAETISTTSGIKTYEFFRWISISRKNLKARTLFSGDPAFTYTLNAGQLLSTLPNKPDKVLFARYQPDFSGGNQNGSSRINQGNQVRGAYSLFEVSLKSGREHRTVEGSENTTDWMVSPFGDPIARIDYDPRKQQRQVYLKPSGSKKFAMAHARPEKSGAGTLVSFWGMAEGSQTEAIVTSFANGDKRGLFRYNLASGEVTGTYFRNKSYDIDDPIYDPTIARPIGANYVDDLNQRYFIDGSLLTLQDSLKKAAQGHSALLTSWSHDKTRFILHVLYTDHPGQFFLYDKNSRQLSKLAATYNALDGSTAARKEKYDYMAADGMLIPGYLTAPANADKTSMPLVVLPHGGPWARDDQSFDYESFFYAARGYLVYQPNFRASTGYGASFRDAGHGEWGGKMQDDITQGVEKLIRDGVADPARICIVGSSYGGYAALAGATLTPDLYACAVSVSGVSNLPGMLGEEAGGSEYGSNYWQRRIGDRFKDVEKLRAVSPYYQASHAKAPILLIHSRDDTVVPIGQSRQMKNALTAAGKEVEYLELKGEDHWLSNGKTRTEMLSASIKFIDRHIGQ